MNAKIWILAALLFTAAAQAQQTWDYSDGNAGFSGDVVLSQALPANGTESVTPSSFSLAYAWLNDGKGTFQSVAAPTFQFTTVNGAITAWDVSLNLAELGTNTPTYLNFNLSNQGDSYVSQTIGAGCMPTPWQANPCPTLTVSSAPGSWVDPPAAGAPELDPSSSASALTLLMGAFLVLRGRRIT